MTFEEIKAQENLYLMQTYGRYPIALVRGEGAKLWDSEGKEYIDLTSGIGVNVLGHNHPAVVGAVTEQAKKMMHCSNLFYSEPMVTAAKKLCTAAGMKRVFFSNSGAEANEGMLKLARKYSHDKYGEGRGTILTLKNSFHGRTITTLKATGQDKFHQHFAPFPGGFDYIEAGNLHDLKAHTDSSTCAVLMELIQGESGVVPLEKAYVEGVAAFCKEHDLLLLIDEVQTGVGRTGALFCYQQYGIHPDIVSTAKGLGGGVPIGAVLAGERCADTFQPGDHGSTFGGNALCCAAADAVLSIIDEEAFLSEVRAKGDYFMDALRGITSSHIKAVRGMGLMIGIETDSNTPKEYVLKLMEKGILALTAGKNVIRLLPPLVISYAEIDSAVQAMQEVFAE